LTEFLPTLPWSLAHFQVHVHFGNPGAFSDHSPAIIRLEPRHTKDKRCFKFFNIWAHHDSFLALVADKWNCYAHVRFPMFILCKKLNHMKGHLKELNKLHFNHISERVTKAKIALEFGCSAASEFDVDNLHHQALDAQLRNLLTLKSAERMFFAQKLKCNFFKESDKGTSFFHALMSHKHRKNFIPAIQLSNGKLSTSVDEVGDAFVNFFKELLALQRTPFLWM